jgi:hypothetical protein
LEQLVSVAHLHLSLPQVAVAVLAMLSKQAVVAQVVVRHTTPPLHSTGRLHLLVKVMQVVLEMPHQPMMALQVVVVVVRVPLESMAQAVQQAVLV